MLSLYFPNKTAVYWRSFYNRCFAPPVPVISACPFTNSVLSLK
ncbi:hypothetical protein B4096_3409 [Heyndrickxia coagulans]|uniref:Uncharacterized protein n=1 Tax=Heyndrickxia coagulans TaxID=1398 RepID=A0A0C5CC58_HEYCO|nr:hypothetical protein SB48_HM08orf03622 [Heyndrickxia coagulans]KWZ76867.1 hypothetical protein HMPREF3213_03604 [Heyndrickxia coagulans]KYC81377.1 hypothetical protein B4096_3409 [Heyndrickxia coagulans]